MSRLLFGLILAGAMNIHFAPAQEKPASGDDPLQQADQLIRSHQLEKANSLLAEFVQEHPENEAANIKLGQVQIALGLYEDALKSFETILVNNPKVQSARDGEAEAAEADALADQKAGIDGSALMCLIRARKFVPDSPQLLLDFGIQAERLPLRAGKRSSWIGTTSSLMEASP